MWVQLSPAFLLIRLAIADVDAPCYLPNGVKTSGFFACDPTAYITSCCPSGWTCYSNSMCVVTDPTTANSTLPIGSSIRGTCTNPQWNNAICGDFCLSDRDIGGELTACGDDKFCCTDDPSCSCETGAFHLSPGVVQTIIGVVGLDHTQTSSFVTSTASVPSSRGSTSTAASTASVTTADPTTPASHSGPLDKPGQRAGLAVGIIAGVVLLAAGVLYKRYISNRRKKNGQQEVIPTSIPTRPPESQDPYNPHNAAGFIPQVPQMARRSEDIRDLSDAPIDNAYERNTPSRTGYAHALGIEESRLPNGAHNGAQRRAGTPWSFISGEGDETYMRPRTNELGS